MRILVVSDTHRRQTILYAVVRKVQPDRILHCGDSEGKLDEIARMTDLPILAVRGNCDSDSELPYDRILDIGSRRILMTHGHRHGVNYGMEEMIRYAGEVGADTILYGHTHVPELQTIEGITVMNPGSISLPRQDGAEPSYGVINVDESGNCEFAIRYYNW